MGKRGRKAKPIQIEIGADLEALRYSSLLAALTAVLPLLAEAIMRSENITRKETISGTAYSSAEPPAPNTNNEHTDLIA